MVLRFEGNATLRAQWQAEQGFEFQWQVCDCFCFPSCSIFFFFLVVTV